MDVITRFRIWYSAQPRALRMLLTINVVAYLVWQLLLMHIDATNGFVREQLALHSSWPGVLLKPWQFITYNFLHLDSGLTGLIHIGFNMLWLVWIGREFEQTHGADRHLAIYLLAGIGGGLLSVLFDVVSPGQYVVYGASASVLGVVSTVATKYPQRRIGLLLIGNVRLVYLLIA
ncbi:MAG: rhomboid family intramembrane serine protease, partial [Rhodothermia bacterium]|nr:rhomboid family intramembrane serine protease [Rhodothermia bacterium]